MAITGNRLHPQLINKIDPVDIATLTPPTGLAIGTRVLVADPIAGSNASATGTGVFAGKEGKIVISDGSNGWTIEDSSRYLDTQIVLVGPNSELWIFWKNSNNFYRAKANADSTTDLGKIGVVDLVTLTPPTGKSAGTRVLVGDPIAGNTYASDGVGAFAGKRGKIAIADGSNNWTFENSSTYSNNQLLAIGDTRQVWLYRTTTNSFERTEVYQKPTTPPPGTIGSPDSVKLTPPTGQAAGTRILVGDYYAGNTYTDNGTGVFAGKNGKIAISDGNNGWTFEDNSNYVNNQLVAIGDSKQIWLYRRHLGNSFERTEAYPKPVRALGFNQYFDDYITFYIPLNAVVEMNQIEVTCDKNNPSGLSLQQNMGGGKPNENYIKLPFNGTIIVSATFYSFSPDHIALDLIHENSGGGLKRRWEGFLRTAPIKMSASTSAMSVNQYDRIYLRGGLVTTSNATNPIAYDAGPKNMRIYVSYISFD